MKIFLDTEYTDSRHIGLISIGLVSEDGRNEFYAERSDYSIEYCNQFVKMAVLPLLDAPPAFVLDRMALAGCLQTWFRSLPRSVTIACDDRTDWELLVDALNGSLPSNVNGYRDLRPLIDSSVFHRAVCRYHEQPGHPWHHSLHDARAHRAGWLAWMDSKKGRA